MFKYRTGDGCDYGIAKEFCLRTCFADNDFIQQTCFNLPPPFLSMQNCPFVSVMHTATMAESGSERSETVANSIGCPFSSVTNPIRFCALSWQIVTNKIIIVVVTLFIIDK